MNTRTPVLLLTILALAAPALAGDLTPPVGPVAPTPGPEPRTPINATNTPGDADSLFKITQPGSYYLTANITGEAGKHGIEIVASGVTLDLMGFDLAGVPAMGAFDGVSITVGGLTNIAVVNGSVRNWGGEGVDLLSGTATNCRVEGVLATDNAGDGIRTGIGGSVSNCSATSNAGHGIVATGACTISNCSAYLNTGNGLAANSSSTIANCSAVSNAGIGISISFNSTAINCSAYNNSTSGISASFGSTVADWTARSNTLDGIVCTFNCMIRGNNCSVNGEGGDGAGIHAINADNRIEGNNCTGADRGIDVDAAGTIIIKNTCAGNTTDWVIVANCAVGPIIDRRGIVSAAINGFTAPSTLVTTDPNANFSY